MKQIPTFRAAFAVLALAQFLAPQEAFAQLRLPSVNLPLPERLGPLDSDLLHPRGERLLGAAEMLDLREVRLGQIGRLLRRHGDVLEADPRGEPVVRREILAWSPGTAALGAARALGLAVLREQRLEGLDETMVVLRVPEGANIGALLGRLRALDPGGSYDFNHVYTGSSSAPPGPGAATGGAPGARKADAALKIGLIDSGVDAGHAAFRHSAMRRWGCGGASHPSPHGTAVAALMVGEARPFRGVAPAALLYAADIYCDSGTGGSADKIAGALAWLARERVAVINMSLVGPPNVALERVVGAMVGRGHLLVAAVGNDGPAAPPLYPASYPGVVGVTGVDRRGRTLPEAARGRQVLFAAPGNNMVSATTGAPPFRPVRGTSFAAPIVAALLAPSLPEPEPKAAAKAVAALARQASGAQPNTISNETGYGIVGAAFRNDPSSFR